MAWKAVPSSNGSISRSDPASPNFGKHWSSEHVIEAFRPSKTTEDKVRNWLIDSGIPNSRITHSDNKGWFAFYATAEEAEALLHTKYHEYEDSVSGEAIPACEKYHLPSNIREHVDYISPGIKLLAPPESRRSRREMALTKRNARSANPLHVDSVPLANPNNLSTCDVVITPACVAALYQIPKAESESYRKDNSLGIFESELQFYTQYDLDSFFTKFDLNITNGTHPEAANIDGGQQSTTILDQAGGEVSLDLELAYPIVYPQTITVYNVDDLLVQNDPNDTYTFGFNTFLDALDGVRHSVLEIHGDKLISCSHIVVFLLTTKQAMTLILTKYTPIPGLGDIMGLLSVAFVSSRSSRPGGIYF